MGREIRSKYRITHTYIQRIHYKLPFTLSNKIELFDACENDPLPIAVFTISTWQSITVYSNWYASVTHAAVFT